MIKSIFLFSNKSRLTEELNNSKMLLLKKEEEQNALQEAQTKIV